MYFPIVQFLSAACDHEDGNNVETRADLDTEYSIPSPDLGFFGSQDTSIETPCLLDSILAQSPHKPEDKTKLVKFLEEITTFPSEVASCDQSTKNVIQEK